MCIWFRYVTVRLGILCVVAVNLCVEVAQLDSSLSQQQRGHVTFNQTVVTSDTELVWNLIISGMVWSFCMSTASSPFPGRVHRLYVFHPDLGWPAVTFWPLWRRSDLLGRVEMRKIFCPFGEKLNMKTHRYLRPPPEVTLLLRVPHSHVNSPTISFPF